LKGLHIIADLYDCSAVDILSSAKLLKDCCIGHCKSAGLTVLGDHFFQFDARDANQIGGATGTVVLAESHLAIHTWPEKRQCTLDIYVCNVSRDNSAAAERLFEAVIATIGPTRKIVQRVSRGIP
jgi:S-adenosylmethionine decarboxylase proenzyme